MNIYSHYDCTYIDTSVRCEQNLYFEKCILVDQQMDASNHTNIARDIKSIITSPSIP